MTTAALDRPALLTAWLAAQRVWDMQVTLSPPTPYTGTGKSHWKNGEPLAYIDLETRQVVVNLALLEEIGAGSSLTGVLAHEIGHHVRFPQTLALAASLTLLEKRLIPGLKQSLTNLFFDLLVNEHVGRTRADELIAVYQGFLRQNAFCSPMFFFYLAIYEELWRRPPATLVPEAQIAAMEEKHPGCRADAKLFAQTFYSLAGIHKQFVYFCSRFIRFIDDPATLEYVIPMGKDMPEPDEDDFDAVLRGLHADETEDALEEARDSGWLDDGGLKDERDDDPLVTVDKISSHLPGKGGAAFKLALVSKHYKRLVDEHILKPPPGTPPPEPFLPSVTGDWEWGDNPRTIDWTASVLERGALAGVQPLRRDLLPDEPSPTEDDFPALEIYLDTSGSMPDPSRSLNAMTLAAQILCASALRKRGIVRGAIYSSGPVKTSDWMYDEETARRFFLYYVGGGTDYPFALLEKWANERSDVVRVIVSDSDFLSNLGSGKRTSQILQTAADRSRLLVALLAVDGARARLSLEAVLKHARFRLAIVKRLDGFAQTAAALAEALFGR